MMKIVHVCISSRYIDGWGYQQNLLPQYLQKNGVDGYIIASSTVFPRYLKKEKLDEIKAKGNKYELDGIQIRRIKTKRYSPHIEVCHNLTQVLLEIQPDAIFHHNFNVTSLSICARYAKCNNIPLVVDNHADIINMNQNKLWQLLSYKGVIRAVCKIYNKEITKAYGVTHSRCDFIRDYYGVPDTKIDFLPIGSDVDLADTLDSKESLRLKYGLNNDDFVVVTGGKMGEGKLTNNLICAVEELKDKYPKLKLILFGSFEDEETQLMANNSNVCSVHGWCDRIKTLELIKLADVACWPYHHTTLIEDAVAVCTSIIIRKTGTTEHLISGNGEWITTGNKDEIKMCLLKIMNFNQEEKQGLISACNNKREELSYHNVAKKVITDVRNRK